MDDTRNAEKAYRKSIELNPNYPEALINLTILELNQGKVKEAKKSFYSFQEACLSGGAIDKEVMLQNIIYYVYFFKNLLIKLCLHIFLKLGIIILQKCFSFTFLRFLKLYFHKIVYPYVIITYTLGRNLLKY